MIGALGATTFVLYSAVAVLLVWKYRRTRDAGFIWLGLPLVLLPIVALGPCDAGAGERVEPTSVDAAGEDLRWL